MIDFIIAIDPGLTGGITILNRDNGILIIHDMPIRIKSKKTQARIKNIVDGHALSGILKSYDPNKTKVALEASNAMRKGQNEYSQGISTLYSTAHTSGKIEGVLEGLGFSIDLIVPRVWKKYLSLGTNKRDSCNLASKLYPEVSDKFKRLKDNNRAESALILYYYINKVLTITESKKKIKRKPANDNVYKQRILI